jgi:hypothetical protein
MHKTILTISIAALLLASCMHDASQVSIVVSAQLKDDAGYALALAELDKALNGTHYRTTISYHAPGDALPKGNKIIVGDIGPEETIGSPMQEEACTIGQARDGQSHVVHIRGDTRGGMYGIFKVAEQLQLGKSLWELSMEIVPEFPLRMYTELGQLYDLPSVGYHLFEEPWVNHERFENEKAELKLLIDQVAKMGFNAFTIMHVNFEDYIIYKYLDKEVYAADDVHRIKARRFAVHLQDIIDYAHDRHIQVFMQVYEFQYPPQLGDLYTLDLGNPEMQKIIEAKVRELFEVVSLDGLVITATESNPRSGYRSIEPWRRYGKAGAGQMMTMYHNAGKALGKSVIFRSWMIAYGAADSDQVIENTPADAHFEIKHTGDDFWLNFPLTDAIEDGLGRKRPLTMTFDVFPQYYGWSRLICYLQRFAEEARIAKENGVMGIQAWGAWAPGCIRSDRHPGYLPNGQLKPHEDHYFDMAGPWNNFRIFSRGFTPGQMNAYLVSRLTWDVDLSAEEIAADWGHLHFGENNAEAVASLLMRSQAAFRELYLTTEKREFSFHPVYFKWATTVDIKLDVLQKMCEKIPLDHILASNKVAYDQLALMDQAFARIDPATVPSPENYRILKEGLEKTRLYLDMFFTFREMWWRKSALEDLNGNKAAAQQTAYDQSVVRFNDILDQWQKYPEECRYWGMTRKSFELGWNTWREDVLRKMGG